MKRIASKPNLTLGTTRLLGFGPLVVSTFLLSGVACSGGSVDISQLREDLEHPTGSTRDATALAAVAQRQQTSGLTERGVGNTPVRSSLVLKDAALPDAGREFPQPTEVSQITIQKLAHAAGGWARSEQPADSQRRQSLNAGALDRCIMDAVSQSTAENTTISGDSFSVSLQIDFERCADAGLTGRMLVEMEGEIDRSANTIEYDAMARYEAVCTSAGRAFCQSGELAQHAQGRVSGSGLELEVGAAWELVTELEDDRETHCFLHKGGVLAEVEGSRVLFERWIVYVEDSEGDERSYVITPIMQSRTPVLSEGEMTFRVRGGDGETACAVFGHQGMCSTDERNDSSSDSVSWGEAEWSRAYERFASLDDCPRE